MPSHIPGDDLVSITVEGKVSESFDKTLGDWLQGASKGKLLRLDYLKQQLGLSGDIDPSIRYQLLHRTASAVIGAKRFNAPIAVMIVHSFSQQNEWFDDYIAFLSLYGETAEVGDLICLGNIDSVKLYVGWVKGDARFLES